MKLSDMMAIPEISSIKFSDQFDDQFVKIIINIGLSKTELTAAKMAYLLRH